MSEKEQKNPDGILFDHLVKELKSFFEKSGYKKAVIGLSGGIDSAVVSALLTCALDRKDITGISMPMHETSSLSRDLARTLASNLDINFLEVNLCKVQEEILKTAKESFGIDYSTKGADVTEENIQARLRMVTLYAYANKMNCLVVNTSNLTEALLGYGTMYGDVTGSISPLGQIGKRNVYRLARYFNSVAPCVYEIPDEIIERTPTAELSPGQTDEGSIGASYSLLDPITTCIFEDYCESSFKKIETLNEDFVVKRMKRYYDEDLVRKVIRMMQKNSFKFLQCPPSIQIPYHVSNY